MTDLERRALLCDRQAQEECTRQGIVLPCQCCSGNARVRYTGNGSGEYLYNEDGNRTEFCGQCGQAIKWG